MGYLPLTFQIPKRLYRGILAIVSTPQRGLYGGNTHGTTIGVIRRDTRTLDYSHGECNSKWKLPLSRGLVLLVQLSHPPKKNVKCSHYTIMYYNYWQCLMLRRENSRRFGAAGLSFELMQLWRSENRSLQPALVCEGSRGCWA